ncbi:MAG TPA: L,D-transpeptidase [Kofleriaceae bacterium]|nr:L,D-transpeptidase [Kofleriaceae bacterium]
MRTLSALFLVGCASSPSHAPEPMPVAPTITVSSLATPIVTPIEPATVASAVKLRVTTTVVDEPSSAGAKLGIIRRGTIAAIQHEADGDARCPRWIEIAPRGWLCETQIERTTEAPTAAPEITLATPDDAGDIPVPGLYGAVRGKDVIAYASAADAKAGNGRVLVGSNSVRAAGATVIDGKRFWKTSSGELIEASSIAVFSPSKFHGVALAPGAQLPAWARSRRDPYKPVALRDERGAVIGKLAPRTIVYPRETSDDGKRVRIDDATWIARDDLRIAQLTEPPSDTAPDEKWFDVDLEDQVLVAYEGERPVYATLVSTGKTGDRGKHGTPPGIARIRSKHLTATMNNDKGEAYSVAAVPWTMYYDGSYALHSSYWHDGFGGRRSHGCINLAPRDARVLYAWSSPDVPPGWIAVYGDVDHPGSLVRVRSKRVPEPGFRGYARTLHDRVSDIGHVTAIR